MISSWSWVDMPELELWFETKIKESFYISLKYIAWVILLADFVASFVTNIDVAIGSRIFKKHWLEIIFETKKALYLQKSVIYGLFMTTSEKILFFVS